MPSDASTETSPAFAARMAGALWLIVIVASIVAVVQGASLDTSGDPATMTTHALMSAARIRLTFVTLFLGKVCYLGATVLIYELFKRVNNSVALFGAFCGLAGILSGSHGINQLAALSLLEESRHAAEPLASQMQSVVKIFTAQGFSGEDVFFGCQVASIGYLIARSSLVPRAIGLLLLLGGGGFIISVLANFLSPPLGGRLAPLLLPIAGLAEGSLALWLLVRGIDAERWRSTAMPRTQITLRDDD